MKIRNDKFMHLHQHKNELMEHVFRQDRIRFSSVDSKHMNDLNVLG